MKFTVLKEFENPLLERKEYDVELEGVKVTPTRVEVVKQFGAKMGLDLKTVVVDTIATSAGTTRSKVYIKAYNSEEALKKIEVKNNIVNWKKIKEELFPSKKEEAPAKEEKKE